MKLRLLQPRMRQPFLQQQSDEESGTLVFSEETAKKVINITLINLNSYTR